MQQLINKTIRSCSWSKDGTKMTITTSEGDFNFYTGSDCCSESWIEHVTEPKYPAKILSIEEKDLPGPTPSGRQEYDQAYSTVFKTDQGDLEVEYRNSSNGYYGGSLELMP